MTGWILAVAVPSVLGAYLTVWRRNYLTEQRRRDAAEAARITAGWRP